MAAATMLMVDSGRNGGWGREQESESKSCRGRSRMFFRSHGDFPSPEFDRIELIGS